MSNNVLVYSLAAGFGKFILMFGSFLAILFVAATILYGSEGVVAIFSFLRWLVVFREMRELSKDKTLSSSIKKAHLEVIQRQAELAHQTQPEEEE